MLSFVIGGRLVRLRAPPRSTPSLTGRKKWGDCSNFMDWGILVCHGRHGEVGGDPEGEALKAVFELMFEKHPHKPVSRKRSAMKLSRKSPTIITWLGSGIQRRPNLAGCLGML